MLILWADACADEQNRKETDTRCINAGISADIDACNESVDAELNADADASLFSDPVPLGRGHCDPGQL